MTETETIDGHGHGDTPSYDDINTPAILLVGAISALVTLLTIMFVQGLCYHWQNSQRERLEKEVEHMPAVVQVQEQKDELVAAKVSIDDAMKKVVSS